MPTSNICSGCGKALFRTPRPKTSKAEGFIVGLLSVLFYGINGIAILAAGVGWLIVLALVILALPFYALFYLSPPVGVIVALSLAGWLIHRSSRPESVARRRQRRQRQKVRRELKSISDNLPL